VKERVLEARTPERPKPLLDLTRSECWPARMRLSFAVTVAQWV